MEPRAIKEVFIGYHERVKGYKVWCKDLTLPRSIISRDVTFDEMTMLKTSQEDKKEEHVPKEDSAPE